MAYLFSDAGIARLDEALAAGAICIFDFDGTLVSIVGQPDKVHLQPAMLKRLELLRTLCPVAIVTGRARSDAQARLGFEPDFLVGNHGLEGVPGWNEHSAQYQSLCHTWREQLASRLRQVQADPGVWVEDKRYSLSVHYRAAQHRSKAEHQIEELLGELHPSPRIFGGKCVFNLVPRGSPDKGSAVLQLLRASRRASALYVGDDQTDEDVFRLSSPRVLSVRVGHTSHTAAAFYLRHRSEVEPLLDHLIARLQAPAANASDGEAQVDRSVL
jgi:trehalose 6-phosphate phosphatase